MPRKIISGGQTGADFGGLLAGKALGLETGGTAPKGWRICNPDGSDGSNPDLAAYGLVEHRSRSYPERTRQNVADSDGTVWIGYAGSPGGNLTVKTCRQMNKPCIINPDAESLRDWVEEYGIEVLNVAGNRSSAQNPGIEDRARKIIYEAFAS
jgi:hypothetical protein